LTLRIKLTRLPVAYFNITEFKNKYYIICEVSFLFNCLVKGNNYCNLYNGEWIGTTKTIDIFSPIDNTLMGTVPSMTKEDIDKTIENSKVSQIKWAETPISERAKILHTAASILDERAEEIGKILMTEIAKDIKSSVSEVKRTAEFIRFTADAGKHMDGEAIGADNFPGFKKNKMSFAQRVPLGSCNISF